MFLTEEARRSALIKNESAIALNLDFPFSKTVWKINVVLAYWDMTLSFLLIFIYKCVSAVPACVSIHHMSARCLQRLEEGLQIFVSHYLDAGNQSWVLWKSNKCFLLLSHLSSLRI